MTARLRTLAVLGFTCLLAGPWAATATPAKRPPAAGSGEEVARVAYVSGKATLKARGAIFPVERDLPLLRTDEVAAGAASFVLVELKNRHVVRIDEELALAVADIFLLDAPPAAKSPQDQIDRLLSAPERRAAGDRIVGYQARLGGAESVPSQPLSQRAKAAPSSAMKESARESFDQKKSALAAPAVSDREQAPEEPSAAFGSRGPAERKAESPAPAAPQEKAARRAPSPVPPLASAAAPASATAPAIAGPPAAEPAIAWFTQTGGTRRAERGPAPALLRRVATDLATQNCLLAPIRGLAGRPASVRILLLVDGGRVTRVALGGGLPVGDCELVGQAVPEIAGKQWIGVEVRLP